MRTIISLADVTNSMQRREYLAACCGVAGMALADGGVGSPESPASIDAWGDAWWGAGQWGGEPVSRAFDERAYR